MRMRGSLGYAVMCTALLAGCGGERGPDSGSGSGGSTPPPTTGTGAGNGEGLWRGTTSNGRAMAALVTDDGSYFLLYSSSGNNDAIAGAIQGTGSTSSTGTFASGDARDFNLEGQGVLQATVSATVTAPTATDRTFNGSITYSTTTINFTSRYDADYDTVPTLARITGTYVGELAVAGIVQDASTTIDSSGTISGSSGSCAFTGRASARADGNAYNITVQFGTSTLCASSGQFFSGLAYLEPTEGLLYAIAPNAGRTAGVLLVGTKNSP